MQRAATVAHHAWNHAEFRRVLGHLPVAAYACDRHGLITCFNEHAAALWGREPVLEDPRDRYCGAGRLFAPDGTPMPHADSWMALALREQREYRGCEIVIERPDGTRVTALAHAKPVHAEDGSLLGTFNVLVDVTDRRGTDAARGDLLQSLGHELRNPLGPVRNALHILKTRGLADPQTPWALDLIERQVGELAALVDSVSVIARLSREPSPMRRSPVDIAALLAEAVASHRASIERRGRRIDAAPGEPVRGTGDAELLRRAFAGLLDAVSRETPAGGTVRASASLTPTCCAVDIAGDGHDAPSHDGTPRACGEASIGLAVARQVASAHGGTLTVAAGHVRMSLPSAVLVSGSGPVLA